LAFSFLIYGKGDLMDEKTEIKLEFNRRLCALVLRLIQFVDSLPKDGAGQKAGDRLLISGTRILGNYVEGQSAGSREDFADFLNYCLESVNESILWICVLRSDGCTDAPEAERLLQELRETGNILGASIKNIKRRK
jgi:four helix bundle protein